MANKISFLVVDDCSGMAVIMFGLIEEHCCKWKVPHNTMPVKSGEEAIVFMNNNHVDILITDLQMPGKNGEELIREASQLYPATYSIIMTGKCGYEPPADLPISGFLEKPFGEEKLFTILEKIIKEIKEGESE